MTRYAIQAVCTTALLLFLQGVGSPVLSDDLNEGADHDDVLRYMHIEVPEDQPELWPRFGHKFGLPIRMEKFQAMLHAVESGRRQQTTSPNSPRFKQITLTGKLVADAFVGEGRFDVEYGGSAPTFVSLKGCQIAISNARWESDAPASIGTASDGVVVMMVEKPGTVNFDWSLKLVRDTTGVFRTDLKIPPTSKSALRLEVPNKYLFTATEGIIGEKVNRTPLSSEYLLELGGRASTRLTLVPAAITETPSGMAIVAQNSRYDVSSTGFALMTQLNVQVFERPFTKPSVEFDLDSTIDITGVQIDGEEADWNALDEKRISIALPQPLPAMSTSRIQIFAVGRLTMGSPVPLPTVSPTDLIWQAADVSIVVDQNLVIQGISAADGTPLPLREVSTDATGSLTTIRLADKNTRILLNVAEQPPQATCERVFAWNIGADAVEGRLSMLLHANSGDIYTANLEIAPHWSFSEEDVKVSTGSKDNLSIVAHRLVNSGRASAEAREVNLMLDPPLRRGQSIRIQITASYDQPLATPSFPLKSLLFADVQNAVTSTKTVIVGAKSPIQAHVSGESDVGYGDTSAISLDHDVEFLEEGGKGVVVTSDDQFRGAFVRLQRSTPRVTANIHSRVEVHSDTVTQQHQIDCIPDVSGVRKLRLVFRPAGADSPRWSLPPDIAPETVSFVRLPRDSENEENRSEPEIWDVTFDAPQTAPFTLGVERVELLSKEALLSVPLLSVADAFSQQARVVVLGQRLLPLSVQSRNVQLLPGSPTDLWDESKFELLGVYRYLPSPTESGSDAAITIRMNRQREAQAFAWRMTLESRLANNRPSAHWATWLIENGSRDYVHVSLPRNCEIKTVLLNGEPTATEIDDDGQLAIPLHNAGRTAEVSVGFMKSEEGFAFWSKVQAPLPEIDVPVLVRQWRVAPPEGFGVRQLNGVSASDGLQSPVTNYADKNGGDLRRGPQGEDSLSATTANWLTAFERRLLSPGSTWGAVLLDAQLQTTNELKQVPFKLLLDPAAFSSTGVLPTTAVNTSSETESDLSDVLQLSGLELVIGSQRVLITGKAFTSLYRQQLTPGPQPGIWIAASPELDELLEDDNSLLEHYITPQVWASALFEPQSQIEDRIGPEVQAIYVLGAGNQSASAFIYHDLSLRSLMIALAIGLAGLTASLRGRALRIHLTICLLAAGICIAAGAPWNNALWMLVVGASLGGAIAVTRRRSANASVSTRPNAAATTIAILGIGLGFTSICDRASAQQTPSVYPVWMPVDDEGRPTNWVYLPQEFEKLLLERSRNLRATRNWIIDQANYSLTLRRRPTDERLEIKALEMEFDVVVLQNSESVSIPLRRADILFGEDWALLNDEPIEPVWSPDESQLRIPIEGAGRHRLQFRVRPVVTVQRNTAKFALGVPPVPNAKLKIDVPADVADVHIGANFGVMKEETPEDSNLRVLTAELGAISNLEIDFPRQRTEQVTPPTYETEEYAWIAFGEQSTIDFKLKGTATEDGLDSLLFEIDEGLEVLSEDVQPVDSTNSAHPLFRVPLQNIEKRFEASFKLGFRQSPEAGVLTIPHIRPVGAKRRRCWLAISGTENAVSMPSLGASQLAVGKFLAGWGEAVQQPNHAYVCDLSQGATLVKLTADRTPRAVNESTICSFSSHLAQVEYRAQLDPTEHPAPQLWFRLPPGLNVESVEILAQHLGTPGPHLAWWGSYGQDVQLFLTGDLTAAFEVRVLAAMEVLTTGAVRVPLIQLVTGDVKSSRVDIFRKPDANVEVVRQAGFDEVELDPSYVIELGRAVASLQAQLPLKTFKSRLCVVKVRPNKLAATGTQVTRLERHDSAWLTEVDFHVATQSGVVDRLRFEVPAQHIDTLQLTPAIPYRVGETVDESRRVLTIEPSQAIDGEFDIKLTMALASSAGDEVTLPSIRPICDFPSYRFVSLPSTIDSRNIFWNIEGLEHLSNPPENLDSVSRQENTQIYEVTADPHRAKLSMITDLTGVPMVRLADIYFAWNGAGQSVGRALLDLTPAGMASCVLQLPKEMRLCQALIDDSLCDVTALGEGRWRLKLASTKLPQRIDVLYSGPYRAENLYAHAPVIADVAVERTLWTVYSPLTDDHNSDSESISPIQQDLMRLRSMSNTIRLPRHLRLEFSSDEMRDWLGPWQSRWQSRRRQLAKSQLVRAEMSNQAPADSSLQAIDLSFQQSIDELDLPAAGNLATVARVGEVGNMHDARWRQLVANTPVVSRRMEKGESRSVAVKQHVDSYNRVWWGRMIAAGLLFVVAGVIFVSPKLFTRTDWHLRCGVAAAVAVLLVGALLAGTIFLWALLALLTVTAVLWLRRNAVADPILSAIVLRSGNHRDV